MKLKLLILASVFALTACSGGDEEVLYVDIDVDHCPPAQALVCGVVDGEEVSFVNDCFAKAHAAIEIKPGLCEGDK